MMAVISTMVFHAVVGIWLLPSREPLRLSPRVAQAINKMAQPDDRIYLCGYTEPMVHYYLTEAASDVPRRSLEAELTKSTQPVLLAISQRSMDRLDGELRTALIVYMSEQPLSGVNEANMRTVTVHVGRLSVDALAKLRSLR